MKNYLLISLLLFFANLQLKAAFVVHDSLQIENAKVLHVGQTSKCNKLIQFQSNKGHLPKGKPSKHAYWALAFALGALILPMVGLVFAVPLVIPALIFSIKGLLRKDKTRGDQTLYLIALTLAGLLTLSYGVSILLLSLWLQL